MYNPEDLKVLLGNSIEEPEVDYDDAEVNSEYGRPVEESALRQFYFVSVTDYMARKDFRSNYLSVINHIRKYTTEEQLDLVNAIIEKLPEKYDFEFSIEINPVNQDDINEIYKFLEFVEFDHEDFIVNVWKYLKPDLNSFHPENFCEHNIPKILKEVEEQLETHYFSETIADFLRTYNKENFIEWFCEKSRKLYTSILIALREE